MNTDGPERRMQGAARLATVLAILFSMAGCSDSEDDGDCPSPSEISSAKQGLTLKCTDLEFSVEADPEAEDFGQIPCRMTTFLGYTSECSCAGDQFAPVSPAFAQHVAERHFWVDSCTDEPPCVCEFLQSTGERLETCHRAGFQSASPGWCWLEPDAGVGEADAVSVSCGKLLRIVGRPRIDGELVHRFQLNCQSTTSSP